MLDSNDNMKDIFTDDYIRDIYNDDYFSSLEDSIEKNISLLDAINKNRLDFIDDYTKVCEVDPDFQGQDDNYPFYLEMTEPEISDSLIEFINNQKIDSEIDHGLDLDSKVIIEVDTEKRLEDKMKDLIKSVQDHASFIDPDLDSYLNAFKNIELACNDLKKGVSIDLESREEEIISNLVSSKIESLISKDKFLEAYDFFSSSKIPSYARMSWDLDEITKERLEEYRSKIINESIEGFKYGTLNSDDVLSKFNKFSDLAEYLEFDLALKEKDFPFHEITEFKFGGEDLKVGDAGKVILIYNLDENYFSVYFSKLRYNLTTKTNDKKELRKLFKNHIFNDIAGYHRNIERPKPSNILGGGAYKVLSKKNIFVDYDSGDFGSMQKEILEMCISKSNYNLVTLDDSYFSNSNLFEKIFTYVKPR